MTSPQDRARLRELIEKRDAAWEVFDGVNCSPDPDGVLYSKYAVAARMVKFAAVNALPGLLDTIDQLEAKCERMEADNTRLKIMAGIADDSALIAIAGKSIDPLWASGQPKRDFLAPQDGEG